MKSSTHKEVPKKDELSKSSKVEDKSVNQNLAKIDDVTQKTSKVKDDKKNDKLTAKMPTGKIKLHCQRTIVRILVIHRIK